MGIPTVSLPIFAFCFFMNPETAYIIGALMMLANGGVLGLVHRDLLPSLQPSAVSWRIGTLLIAGGCLTILAQFHFPGGFILGLTNSLIILGFTAYWRALRQFYGHPDRIWLLYPFLFGSASVFWFSIVQPNIEIRSLIVTICWLILFSGSAATLLLPHRADYAVSRRVLAGIFTFGAAFALFRLAFFLLPDGKPIANVIDDSNWINIVTPMMAGILPVVGTTAFLLMCSERLRRQWERAASTDYLTGLANRRTLAAAGEQRFRAARVGKRPLTVAIVDIDHFKSVNDRFGHEIGDQALKHVADLLEQNCRADELPGRQGGEEFVVVMSDTDGDSALSAGERLRQAVESHPFPIKGTNLPISISVGIAQATPADDNFDQLLGRADAALYRAKSRGRNRVEMAD